jgi:DNA-binding transcriptional regulator LsrR (DeoR family)
MPAALLRQIPRRVAGAGGRRKFAAIRAALRGRWLNVLITDLGVARRLMEDPARDQREGPVVPRERDGNYP